MQSADDRLDILAGYEAISDFVGIPVSKLKYRAKIGSIPLFHLGRTPCARRDALRAWIASAERVSLRGGGASG
ncbi:hypothetical protein [Methylobacterium sp. WSM2598]|uniref:hypothetical protein n=1 Tax=Methylobacterium sp. WSM2598 TaxID=398261 RepID=UPI000381FCAB|nr:hypothetical protein [Methylobacterium sp. WSM2598]